MKSIEEGYKRIYAEDLAAGLGFEWGYDAAADHDLYEALEAMGYEWNGTSWLAPEAQQTEAKPRTARPRRKQVDIRERLRQWNAGEPKPGGMGPP